MGYFLDVMAQTSTRFWINNPTMNDLRLAMEQGAIGCTTNPSYVSKLLADPIERPYVLSVIKDLLLIKSDTTEIASELQRRMVLRLANELRPLYEASNGTKGYVTIQSNPERETDSEFLIADGLANRKIAPNIMVKIPVTESGLQAISAFFEADCPVMATEVMTLCQARCVWNAYNKVAGRTGKTPLLYVTHITGIQDDFFKNTVAAHHISIDADVLSYAGLSIAKRLYGEWKSQGMPGRLIGGGARKLEDFTELVGCNMDITVNWKGTADVLVQQARPVVDRSGFQLDEEGMEILKRDLPGYRQAFDENGLKESDFFEYGGVELFRDSFLKGWRSMLSTINDLKDSRPVIKTKTFGSTSEKRVLIRPGLERVTLTYNDAIQMCYFFIAKGSILEMHTHVPIQNGIVISGKVVFHLEDRELTLSAGDAYLFDAMVPHGLETLEDTQLLECFSPCRDEYKVVEEGKSI